MFLSKILNFFKDKPKTNTTINEDSSNKVTIDIQNEKNIDSDENNKQLATSIISSIIEGVKIMMASLLSIFVYLFVAHVQMRMLAMCR